MVTAHSEVDGGYAIVGDLHGRADLLLRATEVIDPTATRFVVQDAFDKGSDVRETLLVARDIGAIGLACNHSWVTGNALDFPRHQNNHWLQGWHKGYQSRTLASFGLVETGDARRDAANLRSAIEADGLESFLFGTVPYLEPTGDDFIAIHAGLTDEPWDKQKQQLDEFTYMPARYEAAPDQIFDEDYSLSTSDTVPPGALTKKIVVTGHHHASLTAPERLTDNGRRVRLGSRLIDSEPLYIYLTETHELVAISPA